MPYVDSHNLIYFLTKSFHFSGWVYSVLYSTAIGTALKLFSSALQQKLIGENLSRFVKIRQFVGINSPLMKAMRLVVGQDGIRVAKVAVLIGGPDWPVSTCSSVSIFSNITVPFSCLSLDADICALWNHAFISYSNHDWDTSYCSSNIANMFDGSSHIHGLS